MKFPQVDQTRLDRRFNWVGPPDRVSRIRPIKLRRLYDETPLERSYRESWEKLTLWNHDFWSQQNTLFEQRKAEFINRIKSGKKSNVKPTTEEMSAFYEDYLNDQYGRFAAYNKEWYRRNFRLLWLATKVSFVRLRRFFLR